MIANAFSRSSNCCGENVVRFRLCLRLINASLSISEWLDKFECNEWIDELFKWLLINGLVWLLDEWLVDDGAFWMAFWIAWCDDW